MKRRRGFSLVELLVVIAVSSTIVALSVGLLHLLMQMQRDARDQLRGRMTLQRLTDQFRDDAHAAMQLRPVQAANESSGPAWELQLGPDHRIEYRVEEATLVRTEHAGGDVLGRESYLLPEGATVSLDVDDEKGVKLASLRIAANQSLPAKPAEEPAEKPDTQSTEEPDEAIVDMPPLTPVRPVRIDAALGLDHRLDARKGP